MVNKRPVCYFFKRQTGFLAAKKPKDSQFIDYSLYFIKCINFKYNKLKSHCLEHELRLR